jgi:hypothetical protein
MQQTPHNLPYTVSTRWQTLRTSCDTTTMASPLSFANANKAGKVCVESVIHREITIDELQDRID